MSDPINHPSHYTFGKYEVIDVIEDWNLPFHLACVVKYIARAGKKDNAVQDLLKARWYLERYLSNLQAESEPDKPPVNYPYAAGFPLGPIRCPHQAVLGQRCLRPVNHAGDHQWEVEP